MSTPHRNELECKARKKHRESKRKICEECTEANKLLSERGRKEMASFSRDETAFLWGQTGPVELATGEYVWNTKTRYVS